MYYYSTVNNIVTTHSSILEKDGFDIVKIHFGGSIFVVFKVATRKISMMYVVLTALEMVQ